MDELFLNGVSLTLLLCSKLKSVSSETLWWIYIVSNLIEIRRTGTGCITHTAVVDNNQDEDHIENSSTICIKNYLLKGK